jgi:phage tail tape-measure protein
LRDLRVNVRELVTLLGFKLDDGPLKKYDKEIDASKQKTGSLTAAFTKAQFIYNGAMKAISAGASLVRNTIIGATIEMEGYRSQMQAFTGSAEAAADTLAELRDKTIDPLFGTGNLVNAYKQLRTVGCPPKPRAA